jgi:hypothetical protein
MRDAFLEGWWERYKFASAKPEQTLALILFLIGNASQ